MKSSEKIVCLLASAALFVGCASEAPQTAIVKPPVKKTNTSQSMSFPSVPKLPGEFTVEDVLADFGDYAGRKMKPYFARAKVAFPPREVVFLALKQEKKVEVWAKDDSTDFRFIRDYDIQAASGRAGPKLMQGDRQVPEGVYRIIGLNPNSHYHLSMKLNYPNEFDLARADEEGRYDPGSDIFIHGKAASIGCLAMGDEAIEELFVLTAWVGQEHVKVIIAPRDPRQSPLEAGEFADLPAWAPELYETITSEARTLTPPITTSSKAAAQQAAAPAKP
jgi:hypothetical protein